MRTCPRSSDNSKKHFRARRLSGPQQSSAALVDGKWRLLPLLESAGRISGPICRFTWQGTAGWLELRDNLFYFYPGEIFRWR